jgi:hypothetical protein
MLIDTFRHLVLLGFWLFCRLENYSNPRTVLFVTLTRTFLMEMVVVGVVVAFWLTFQRNSEASYFSTSLTAWNRVFFEKWIVVQLLKKFRVFYGTWRYTTVFTRARHCSLPWARWINFTTSHPVSLRSILILSSQLCLGTQTALQHTYYRKTLSCRPFKT